MAANSIPFIDVQEDDDGSLDEKMCGFSAIEIKMFAVSKNYQDTLLNGELISSLILKKIIDEIYWLSINTIGAKMILLFSVKKAEKFYIDNKFNPLEKYMKPLHDVNTTDCIPMYMRIHE